MKTFLMPLYKYWYLVLAATVVAAALAGWQREANYESRARILFKLGDEFLQSSVGPDARSNGRILLAEAMNTDVQILTSHDQYRKVVEALGVDSFRAPGSDLVQFGLADAIESLRAGLNVKSVENSAVIHLGFTNADPARAPLVLKTLIDVYLKERGEVLEPTSISVLESVTEEAFERYQDARQAHETALRGAGGQDMEATLGILRQQQMSLMSNARDTRRQLNSDRRQLEVVEAEILKQPTLKELFSEPRVDFSLDRARSRLVELQVQEKELLGKFTQSSRRITDLRLEIAELRRIIGEGETSDRRTLRRTGSNPIREQLEQQQIQLTINIAGAETRLESLTEQEGALRVELEELEQRFIESDRLNDAFAVAETRFRNVDDQLLEYRIFSDTLAARDPNVRVIEQPTLPRSAIGLPTGVRVLLGGLMGFLAGWLIAVWIEVARSASKRSTGVPDRRHELAEAGEMERLAYFREGLALSRAQDARRPSGALPVLGEFFPASAEAR